MCALPLLGRAWAHDLLRIDYGGYSSRGVGLLAGEYVAVDAERERDGRVAEARSPVNAARCSIDPCESVATKSMPTFVSLRAQAIEVDRADLLDGLPPIAGLT